MELTGWKSKILKKLSCGGIIFIFFILKKAFYNLYKLLKNLFYQIFLKKTPQQITNCFKEFINSAKHPVSLSLQLPLTHTHGGLN